MVASAMYEGVVRHCRHTPREHAFSYRMAQLYLDLDEIDLIFRDRWLWSVGRRNLAEWRRSDYLGPPEMPLAQAVRQRIASATGFAPSGPIRLLTHARYAGYIFNPVSFYYCYQPDGVTLDCLVAEITNTPWKERYAYVLPVSGASYQGRALEWNFHKTFHVSPFMPLQRAYEWKFTVPDQALHVHMRVLEAERLEFEATLTLKRHPLDGRSLARVLWRYPLMTLQVIGVIHWQALRLWLKSTPVFDHPTSDMESDHD
jgi:DUF1365 family protein